MHAALKKWYATPADQFEVPVDGYVIDVVRDNLLIEIQTGNFSNIKAKLYDLAKRHPVRLVYPIAADKWIVKLDEDLQEQLSRRKSPKHGRTEHIFYELVRIPQLLARPKFSLEVLLIQEEEHRRHEPGRRWRRRGWVTHERYLLSVVESRLFTRPADLLTLLPPTLPALFTTADMAEALGCRRAVAQKMAYCLRKLNLLIADGKQGNSILYYKADLGEGV